MVISMKNLEKCSRRQAFYNKLIRDWNELNLHFKALMVIGSIIIGALFLNIFINQLSNDTRVLFTSTILSIFGFLLSGKKTNTQGMFRMSKDCNEEIEEYNFNCGNLIQILISIFLIIICIISIIFINLTENYSLFSFFRDLMNVSIGFLLGESKSNN